MENVSVEEKEGKVDGEIDTKEEVGQQEETADKHGAKASEKGEKTADEVEEAERSVSQEALSAPDSADTVDTDANTTAGEGEGTQVAERSAEHGSENGTCKHCRCCVSTGTIESKIEERMEERERLLMEKWRKLLEERERRMKEKWENSLKERGNNDGTRERQQIEEWRNRWKEESLKRKKLEERIEMIVLEIYNMKAGHQDTIEEVTRLQRRIEGLEL